MDQDKDQTPNKKKNSDSNLSVDIKENGEEKLDGKIESAIELHETKARLRTKSFDPVKGDKEIINKKLNADAKITARRTKSAELNGFEPPFISCPNTSGHQRVKFEGVDDVEASSQDSVEISSGILKKPTASFAEPDISYGHNGDAKLNNTPEQSFDAWDEIYLANACCDCMHYRTATAVVGILEIVFIFIWAACGISYYILDGVSEPSKGIIGCQVAVGVILLVIISLLFTGVILQNHIYLYPHMFLQLSGIAVALILTVLAVIVMAVGNNTTESVFGFLFGHDKVHVIEERFGPIWPFCLACIFDFLAAIGIWFFVIVKGYYDYLQDKIYFDKLGSNSLHMNGINNNDMMKNVSSVTVCTNDGL